MTPEKQFLKDYLTIAKWFLFIISGWAYVLLMMKLSSSKNPVIRFVTGVVIIILFLETTVFNHLGINPRS